MTGPLDGRSRIRRAVPADVDWMARLDKTCFAQDFWPRAAFLSEFQSDVWPLIADVAGRSAGYICLMAGPDELHITNLAVDPAHRRKGLGRQLVMAAMSVAASHHASQIFLDVRPSNHAAIRLYESLGFVALYRRRAYYIRPPEDGLVLARNVVAGDLDSSSSDPTLKG